MLAVLMFTYTFDLNFFIVLTKAIMAPSRGLPAAPSQSSSDDAAIHQQSNSALANARRNLNYLINPKTSAAGDRPARLWTRALLRSIRYISQVVLWRLVRWAKYAAIGAIVAAVGATAFGAFASGVGWIIAPPSIGASIVAMSIWKVGGFAAQRLHKRWQQTGKDEGQEQRERREDMGDEEHVATRAGRGLGPERGPQAVPW